jgi:hypothetical protein
MTLDDLTTLKEFATSIGYEVKQREHGFGIKFPNTHEYNSYLEYSQSVPNIISIAPYAVHLFDESVGYKMGYMSYDLKTIELNAVKNMLNRTMENKKEYLLNQKMVAIEEDF